MFQIIFVCMSVVKQNIEMSNQCGEVTPKFIKII